MCQRSHNAAAYLISKQLIRIFSGFGEGRELSWQVKEDVESVLSKR